MNIQIALVPPGQVTFWIVSLTKYLKKSEIWTRGRATIDDIVRFIYSGQMQLWVFYEPETMQGVGHMITEIKSYPACKMLVLQYCAGEPNHMKYCEDEMHQILENFARDSGCTGIEFIGRPGWKKSALSHGYIVESTIYEKYL